MRKLHYWLMDHPGSIAEALLSKNRQDAKLARSRIPHAGNNPERTPKSSTFVLEAANQKATGNLLTAGSGPSRHPFLQNLLRQLIIENYRRDPFLKYV